MELATRRKRGPIVVACAMGGIVVAFGIQYVLVYEQLLVGSLIALAVGLYLAYQNLR
jgi:predicted histidine transporter YuiF (NhaC family)